MNITENAKANLTKNIELPPIITATHLYQAQMKNKIPEHKIKKGIKRDHLTQQSMNDYITSSTNISSENEECVTKKPKIANTDSDMEISSDDEVQIIDNSNYSHLTQTEKTSLEKQNDISNYELQESLYHQTTSTQLPNILMASNMLRNNYESNVITRDLSNVENDIMVIDDIPPTYQDKQILHKPNNICTNSLKNIKRPLNGLSEIAPLTPDLYNDVTDLLEDSPNSQANPTIQQNALPLNQNQNYVKQPSVEHTSIQQNIEVSSSKSSISNLFGDDSDDESKVPLVDVKRKSLGVRLSMSLNDFNTFKTNKKPHESMKTMKHKTEDPNNKQKKFELSNLVVNLLNPLYRNGVFDTKELFKFMAREIVHKLLESTSHPGKLIIRA